MEISERLIEFWVEDSRYCVLYSVERSLEVRLYDNFKLVGLEPCENGEEALEISRRWRYVPPAWPPY
jgi:hypothetical protein